MDHSRLPAQDLLLAVLCYADDCKMVRQLVELPYYDNFYRQIAEEVYRYIDQFDRPPGEHTYDLMTRVTDKHPDDHDVYNRIYQSVEQLEGNHNVEFIMDQAQRFVRQQRMRDGMKSAIQALNTSNPESIDEAHTHLEKALTGSNDLFDPGTLITDTGRSLGFLDTMEETFPTGIEPLDRWNLGPLRKGLHLFGGVAGAGKSLWLLWLARCALLSRKKVLYVTLEMSEELVCQRFFQNTMAMTKRKQDSVRRRSFERNGDGEILGFEVEDIAPRPFLGQSDVRSMLSTKTARIFGNKPKFYVKNFPSGRLSVRELEAYLDSLMNAQNFIPDLLLVDYADLMDSQAGIGDHRVGLGRIYVQLRGIAVERNIAVATATQLNRSAVGKAKPGLENISEDFSKAQTADIVINYAQSKEEEKLGLARLIVGKNRSDRSGFSVLLTQCYEMCQFVVDCVAEVPSYKDVLKDHSIEDEEPVKRTKRRKLASGTEPSSS